MTTCMLANSFLYMPLILDLVYMVWNKKEYIISEKIPGNKNLSHFGISPEFLPTVFIYFSFFYCCSITVVCIFSPLLHPTPAKPTSLPCLHPHPWFCPCVLYISSSKPFSPLYPPHFPLAIVRVFLTSMSLVIFCLLFSSVDYVPVKGEIIWYLSLTAWLISLSIVFSSSTHAVAKGISSFFLSAA